MLEGDTEASCEQPLRTKAVNQQRIRLAWIAALGAGLRLQMEFEPARVHQLSLSVLLGLAVLDDVNSI